MLCRDFVSNIKIKEKEWGNLKIFIEYIIPIIVFNFIAAFYIFLFIGNFNFFNPFVIYKKRKVNWFGALLIAIIFNIMFPFVALLYWIYKICTVGRK